MLQSIRHWLLSSVLFISWGVYATAFQDPTTWHDPAITQQLAHSLIKTMQPMHDVLAQAGKQAEFFGEVYLVNLENGLKAVFKAVPPDDLGDALAEVAAYKASILLGFPYVPPTVIRTINGQQGSLQLFVETAHDLLAPGVYQQVLAAVSADELAHLKLFYFILGQWDSGPHNLLAFDDKAGQTHLVAIDNSGLRNRQFVKYGDLPFVRVLYNEQFNTDDFDKPFPFEQAESIENPTVDRLKEKWGHRVPEWFYKNFKSYGSPLRYVIYQNSLWRQYHAFDDSFMRSYSSYCPEQSRLKLQSLNLKILKQIFDGAQFATDIHLNAILERRDQVLTQTM